MTRRMGATLNAVAMVATLALGAAGCSRFEPIDGTDTTDLSDVEQPDSKVDEDADHDTTPPEDADATAPPDAEPELPPDVSPDVGDADVDEVGPDVPDADVPTCESTCATAGEARCHPTEPNQIETCTKDAVTGCLDWVVTTTCASTNKCKGPFTCQVVDEVAQCAEDVDQAPPPCPDLSGNPCLPHVCNPDSGQCEPKPLDVGQECDDGDPCTLFEACDASLECTTDILDTVNCSCANAADCEQHDDGDKCNGVYACINTTCIMGDPAPPCGPHDDPCLQNACDPPTGACVAVPGNEGLACDDGDKCSTASACVDGVCEGTTYKECPVGVCEVPQCDAVTGTCGAVPVPNCCGNGTAEGAEQCDDGNDVDGDGCSASCTLPTCAMQGIDMGGNACLVVPGGVSFGTGDLTVELLFKPAAGAQTAVLFDAMDPATPGTGWQLTYTYVSGATANLQWREVASDGVTQVANANIAIPGQWQHIAVVRRANGEVRWYNNGAHQSGLTVTLPNAKGLGQAELYIGCEGASEDFFAGLVDEVRISKVARYTGGFSPPVAPYDPDADTLALYHFDETRPGLSADQTANGHHAYWLGVDATVDHGFGGKPAAKAVCLVTPCARHALDFDPAEQGVATVAAPTVLNGQQTLTVEFYAKIRANTKSAIISRSTSAAGGADWHIEVFASGDKAKLRWVEGQSGTSLDTFGSMVAVIDVTTPQWRHYAVTRSYDAGSKVATVTWFIDGKKETAQTLSPVNALATAQDLYIGSQGGATLFYDGLIDELRISKGALYTGDFVPPTSVALRSDTLALWRFDEGDYVYAHHAYVGQAPPAFLLGATWSDDQPSALAACPK